MAARTWKCQRVTAGEKCGQQNPKVRHICTACGKKRPPTKKAAHLKALNLTYEEYIERTGGNFCALCGAEPPLGKKLHRDHDHAGEGTARALLCFRCNTALPNRVTPDWLRRAADYLERWALPSQVPNSGPVQ